ncbi:hypothetical protein CsatB_021759 [Cannabis sativa]
MSTSEAKAPISTFQRSSSVRPLDNDGDYSNKLDVKGLVKIYEITPSTVQMEPNHISQCDKSLIQSELKSLNKAHDSMPSSSSSSSFIIASLLPFHTIPVCGRYSSTDQTMSTIHPPETHSTVEKASRQFVHCDIVTNGL